MAVIVTDRAWVIIHNLAVAVVVEGRERSDFGDCACMLAGRCDGEPLLTLEMRILYLQ